MTLGNGSNDVLVLLAEAFLTPDVEAVYSQYAFAVYPIAVQACGAVARVARARPAEDPQPLGHDAAAILAAIGQKTRLLFVANPNNPTGTWLDEATLGRLLSAVPTDVIVVLDDGRIVESGTHANLLSRGGAYAILVAAQTSSHRG